MSGSIIDRIDELVEQQLQQEASGYDHNINQEKCWHCGRDWHGLPVTQRIADMYSRRTFDEDYRLADDDSPVLCEGSDLIGPIRADGVKTSYGIGSITIGTDLSYTSGLTGIVLSAPWVVPFPNLDEPPEWVRFWDCNWNSLFSVPATDWEFGEPGHAQFRIAANVPAGLDLLNAYATTDEPSRRPSRRLWRIHTVTIYRDGHRLVVLKDVQMEQAWFEQMTAGFQYLGQMDDDGIAFIPTEIED